MSLSKMFQVARLKESNPVAQERESLRNFAEKFNSLIRKEESGRSDQNCCSPSQNRCGWLGLRT